MISLKKARMATKKMIDLKSTKKIILGRESDTGEQKAKRARKEEWVKQQTTRC